MYSYSRLTIGTHPPAVCQALSDFSITVATFEIPPPTYLMTERGRSSDRPAGSLPHQPSAHGYFMGLFGGSKKAAPPSTTRAHATNAGHHASARASSSAPPPPEEILSPKSGSSLTLPGVIDPVKRSHSPATFDLHAAIEAMQVEEEQTSHLAEVVNSTAVHLGNLLLNTDDIFSTATRELPQSISAEDIRTLYIRAAAFANAKAETPLRISAVRLLAALIATYPPTYFANREQEVPLPDIINVCSLYRLIISPTTPGPSHIEAIFVQVGALKALTKNGQQVDGLDGLVGWLFRSLSDLTEEFVSWCTKKEDWDNKQNVSEAVIAIIELLHPIVITHIPLFAPEDIARVVDPILDLITAGIAASPNIVSEEQIIGSTSRRSSPLASAMSSPISSTLGFEPSLRQSIVSNRSGRKDTSSSLGTPKIAHARQISTSEARWIRPIPALCSFLDALVEEGPLVETLFEKVLVFLCLCFGQDEAEVVPESTWNALYDVLHSVLSPKLGRRGEQVLHSILEGKVQVPSKVPEADRKVTRGAVIASRSLFQHLSASQNVDIRAATTSHAAMGPYLRAAQSTSRFIGSDKVEERSKWHPVDYEILALLQDHMYWLENANNGDNQVIGDVWTEGSTACELLQGAVPVAMEPSHTRQHAEGGEDVNPLRNVFDTIIHQLPLALGKLHPNSTTAPLFFHPKYIDLLIKISTHLDEEDAGHVIDYYQRECLCLPFTSNWIQNIWKLVQAFYLPSSVRPTIRRKVTTLIFRDVYSFADDLPEHRIEIVDRAIVPFLETVFNEEQDEEFVQEALAVLISAAVAETTERDEQQRLDRASRSKEDNDAEDDATKPSEEMDKAITGGSFDAIRNIIMRLATQTPCKETAIRSAPQPSPSTPSSVSGNETGGLTRRSSVRTRETTSTLRGLVDAISPPRQTRELPPISAVASPATEHPPTSIPGPSATSPTTEASVTEPQHSSCRSLHAVDALIAIFVRLAFAPPHEFSVAGTRTTRTPASSRCLTIYRDLLGLLYPMTDDTQNPSPKISARCPRARLSILQFLMRFRADGKHRVYLRQGIDKPVAPYAAILKRTADTEPSEDTARRSTRGSARAPEEDRGRGPRAPTDSSTRSRSRSRAAIIRTTDATPYNPLWHIPDLITFEMPKDTLPSEGLLTYDSNHPSLQDSSSPPVEGVWLPVSEYVRVLNGILRGHDWELVSYVLTFLPLQLSNKLFFHGSRATREVRALLDVLSTGVLGGGTPWDRRYTPPSFIKRTDINAAAYQTLSILISYRGVFTRQETDRLVQAFMAGLQGKEQLARPCLQALTLAVYELEQSVSRNMTEIIRAMINILSTTGLAVHILEFLIALGQNGSLIRNFTDEQYRLVFRVAIGYITEHNARSDITVDITEPATREAYILSQHVIGVAYHAIYEWFLALRLPSRPNLVSEITREILKGRSQRVLVDEMAEVCFDWLARYTYGNADPKPAQSFLSEMVMQGGEGGQEECKSSSWMLGGAIITVTSHPRSGWATVTTTRPTGTTAVVCKVENIPLVDIGEADADMLSLPAALMANRNPESSESAEDAQLQSEIVSAKPSDGTQDVNFDQSAQHGSIWSGATPSQRRKDVVVDPGYLAIQLLSSYPNASLDTPRGRLIPPEDKYMRTLRGIQNTSVIDTMKIAVLYVGPGQTTETEILGNVDGSPLYLDFLSGLGRLIRLKGQVDVFVGGLNRENDSDGEYAYAWFDDLVQIVYHTPTMMPNSPAYPKHEMKKRLVGNDYVKIVYNDSGKEFAFDTIETSFNFINIVISPFNTGAGEEDLPRDSFSAGWKAPFVTKSTDEGFQDWDREDWFKVTIQRADGIPDFSPIGTHKLVSRRALPILVRHFSQLAYDLAARFVHIRQASNATDAEYITSWRSRLRAMHRLQSMLPPVEVPEEDDVAGREQMLRDFTRLFTYRQQAKKEDEK